MEEIYTMQSYGDSLVQLAARVPQKTKEQVKNYCVRNSVRMQHFIEDALKERLKYLKRKGRRRSR